MTEHKLPRPRTRPTAAGWSIDFGNGATGYVDEVSEVGYRWCMLEGTSASGWSRQADHAFLSLWCRAASLSLPPPVTLDDEDITIVDGVDVISPAAIERLATEAESAPVVETAKLYRRLLARRTGFAWSVRVGAGRTANMITIKASKGRMLDGKMTPHDIALLAAITGRDVVSPTHGITVGNSMRQRRQMVYALAGVDEPCAGVIHLSAHR